MLRQPNLWFTRETSVSVISGCIGRISISFANPTRLDNSSEKIFKEYFHCVTSLCCEKQLHSRSIQYGHIFLPVTSSTSWSSDALRQTILMHLSNIRQLKVENTLPPPTHGATAPSGPRPPHYLTITLRRTTLSRTPLDEWPARRRDLYLTKLNTHKRQTATELEPAIPASERPQTHAIGSYAI